MQNKRSLRKLKIYFNTMKKEKRRGRNQGKTLTKRDDINSNEEKRTTNLRKQTTESADSTR